MRKIQRLGRPSLAQLRSIPIFKDLSDSLLREIRAGAEIVVVEAGYYLMEQKHECFYNYILLEGEAVFTYTEVDKPLYLLDSRQYDMIGSVPLVIGRPSPSDKPVCPCDSSSLTPCKLICIESDRLRKIYEESDTFVRNMSYFHAVKLQRVLETLIPLAQAGVMGRLLSCLHRLFLKDGEAPIAATNGCLPRVINRKVTNQELAERVGSSISVISKAMTMLIDAKLIVRTPETLSTPDANKLYKALKRFSRTGKLI